MPFAIIARLVGLSTLLVGLLILIFAERRGRMRPRLQKVALGVIAIGLVAIVTGLGMSA